MRVSLRAKQTAAVTALIALSMTALSALHLANLARVGLENSRSNGELLGRIIYQKARETTAGAADPVDALQSDVGLRSILESAAAYGRNVTYAAIVDTHGVAVTHSFRALEGRPMEPQLSLSAILDQDALAQFRAIYADTTLEIVMPLQFGDSPFGAIRIGLSPLLIRNDLSEALKPMIWLTLVISAASLLTGLVLARRVLRPIHVINSGLMRLRRGETGVTIDLPPEEELEGLDESFKAIGNQLAARSQIGSLARIESFVEQLEDAVAILNAQGGLLFANSAMRDVLPQPAEAGSTLENLPADHPYRRLATEALRTGRSQGPLTATVPATVPDGPVQERLITAHVIEDTNRGTVGVMLVARNLAYLTHVRSTVEYAQKLASLGRLMAGVTHEVKNPLNAMTIHLELVREHLSRAAGRSERRAGAVLGLAAAGSAGHGNAFAPEPDPAAQSEASARAIDGAREHVEVIASEIKRLDEVISGFLRFIRPQELQLQSVDVQTLMSEVLALVEPEARRSGITCRLSVGPLPELRADPSLIRQALLNLALNGCQAMPKGGELRMSGRAERDGRIALIVEDTGVGIPASSLEKIFDLYYTTKPGGSGVGLSVVFRIVQLHGGEIAVESLEGRGTTFRLLLPRA